MNIELQSCRITFDEGDYFWLADMELTDPEDRYSFPVGLVFPFNIGGEAFQFQVDQLTVSKDNSDGLPITVILKCRSPGVQLIAPLASPLTKTWGTTTAQAVATEVLNGWPCDWQILDWPLSDGLFAVNRQCPLDIVRTLVEAVGAVVESLPDGSLQVRYKYPVPATSYAATTPDHDLFEFEHSFSSQESLQAFRAVTLLRIGSDADSSDTQSDRMEFKDGAIGAGTVLVYPSPWRDDFTLSCTHSGVSIGPQTYAERTEEQILEVKDGKASVSYPIYSLTSAVYQDTDLGTPTFDVGGTKLTMSAPGYSMVKITYVVRTYNYDVMGPLETDVQFLMESA